MKRTKISAIYADAAALTDAELTVCGWVRTIRDMKNFAFIELNDGKILLERYDVFPVYINVLWLCLAA